MSALPLSILFANDVRVSGVANGRNTSPVIATSGLGAVVQKPEKDQASRYYNPLTFREETEEELWASCGNWDL